MVIDAVGAVLPSAVAVALSPFPVVAVILVLGSPHARTSGPVFALGWVVGLSVLSVMVVFLVAGAGAVLYRLVRGDRAAAGLDSTKAFMIANNAVIMMVILVIFGVKLLSDGVAGL